jgi:hypothetical protein
MPAHTKHRQSTKEVFHRLKKLISFFCFDAKCLAASEALYLAQPQHLLVLIECLTQALDKYQNFTKYLFSIFLQWQLISMMIVQEKP